MSPREHSLEFRLSANAIHAASQELIQEAQQLLAESQRLVAAVEERRLQAASRAATHS